MSKINNYQKFILENYNLDDKSDIDVKPISIKYYDWESHEEVDPKSLPTRWFSETYDDKGNVVFSEDYTGYWKKTEYDEKGKIINWEDSTQNESIYKIIKENQSTYTDCIENLRDLRIELKKIGVFNVRNAFRSEPPKLTCKYKNVQFDISCNLDENDEMFFSIMYVDAGEETIVDGVEPIDFIKNEIM